MNRGLRRVFGSVLLASVVMVNLVSVGLAFEVDVTDSVTRVVDGDTFESATNGVVRLADVDAPESDEPGFDEATDTLAGMIGGREVFLDVDDKGSTSFGRLICVVYVRFNATHVLNVNKAMVDQGRAVVSDFTNNEFNPSTWTTYTHYPGQSGPAPLAGPGPPYVLAAIAVIIVVVVAGLLYMGLRRKSENRRQLRTTLRCIGSAVVTDIEELDLSARCVRRFSGP